MLEKSLNFYEQILDMPLPDVDDKTFGKVLQLKQQAAASVFTITARVRAQALRPVEDDGMEAVLAAIRQVDEPVFDDPLGVLQ